MRVDVDAIETPAYVVDLGALRRNLDVLADVQARAECSILLALKGFAMWSTFPIVRKYLAGVAASGPIEARLGREEFGKQVHTYAPAYSDADFRECVSLSDHVVVNSVGQWQRFRPIAAAATKVKFGIRVNPEHSEVKTQLYDPCAPGSRLGATAAELNEHALDGITGLHFHTLCELGSDALARTLPVFEAKFGKVLSRMKWVNFGGGHHITRHGYDVDLLVKLVRDFGSRHKVQVFLEPGEAVALGTGVLVSCVLDVVRNGDVTIAILDTSATAHMPDVLEMPYRPEILGASASGEKKHTYRLGGLTCLAGDVIGDWSFDTPLKIGQKLVFLDMAHYTMVKNTTFNGVRLPSIATYEPDTATTTVVRRFGYEDYKVRL